MHTPSLAMFTMSDRGLDTLADPRGRQGCAAPGGPNSFITVRKRGLGQGNVFTPVCHSADGGWVVYPSM